MALLSALMLSLSAYAASMEFSISPSIDVADYIASAEGVTEVDLSDDVAKGFAVSAGIFGDIYPWLSAGGVAYADVRSLINEDGALITIPFMAALRFSYPGGDLEIPLTIMAGGHAQIAGSYVKFGPAFALSAGISVKLTENNLEKYLGKARYIYDRANETDEVGIVRGLAWTSVGGDTLQIEVNIMPGRGEISLTGQLGDVMKESARTGLSYIRSVSEHYGIGKKFFREHDIHIHIPEGAVPKDGPSAGITMATAMLSAITGIPVYASVAMTGEITLRGRVLPIGGLKEKILAAKSAGIKTVIVPARNKRDVEDISPEIKKGLRIVYAEQMKDVLEVAFHEN